MSPQYEVEFTCSDSFPRVSGDEPVNGTSLPTLSKFSPRERG